MRTPIPTITLIIAGLALSSCSKSPAVPPLPKVATERVEPRPTTGVASDVSVPTAESVLTPANAVKVDPAAGRSNNAMSRAQESSAMPMPGQNNDHSAPLPAAKRASGP